MNYRTRHRFALPVDRTAVARAWAEHGYSCDLFVDPPGRTWVDFIHSCNELVTVVEGRLRMTIDDQVFVAEPGDEVFIPKGAEHSVENIHPSTTKWLYGYD